MQRPFGLATLILHTAGTHGASVQLPGLALADAEAMRDRIRAKIRQESRVSDSASEPRRLHPATLIVRWLKVVPQMLFAGVGVGAAGARGRVRPLPSLCRAVRTARRGLRLPLLVAVPLHARARRDRDREGALSRQRRVIPFDRVQDIAIEQRLLARLTGTAKVRIETGGAAKDEGDLDVIALADAHALRDFIRHGAAAAVPGEEAPPAPAEEPVLFAMDMKRLLISGLFGFSLIFLAAISAAVQQLDQFGLVEWENWFTEERAEAAAGLATFRFASSLALLVILLGMVAGIARTVLRDYGFTLTRTAAGLRRRRGLFTLSEVVIPIRRTQVALIESGLVSGALGWHRLSFQTLGADKKEGGVQVAAPFARMEELLPILAEAGFEAPPPRAGFRGTPKRALLGKIAPYALIAAPLTVAAFLFDWRAGIGAVVMAALALACGAALAPPRLGAGRARLLRDRRPPEAPAVGDAAREIADGERLERADPAGDGPRHPDRRHRRRLGDAPAADGGSRRRRGGSEGRRALRGVPARPRSGKKRAWLSAGARSEGLHADRADGGDRHHRARRDRGGACDARAGRQPALGGGAVRGAGQGGARRRHPRGAAGGAQDRPRRL